MHCYADPAGGPLKMTSDRVMHRQSYKKTVDKPFIVMLKNAVQEHQWKGGGLLGSVIKKRRKKMRKHKHRKLLAKTRHQRRKGK
jgi:hypothetical protein